jgi:hypothetical protein
VTTGDEECDRGADNANLADHCKLLQSPSLPRWIC